ncbi:MAG: nucleoside phosphorylase [Chitinophagales bacterium]
MNPIGESELILNPDGSIYHLNLLPSDIADTIITVGDPDRVAMVSKYFDTIEVIKHKREFVTHTGMCRGKRLTVISTGIGTSNIEIVYTELDALVNIDLETREVKEKPNSLNFIRIGTSGGLRKGIEVDSFVASAFGIGLDNLMAFYDFQPNEEEEEIQEALPELARYLQPYVAQASYELLQTVAADVIKGITITSPGFYAPQSRTLRVSPMLKNKLQLLQEFEFEDSPYQITNFEMETASMYAFARLFGHNALSMNAIIANRVENTFSEDPKAVVEKLIVFVLDKLCDE